MNFKTYRIGLVASRAGFTDGQLATVKQRLKEVARFLGEDGVVELHVPFGGHRKSGEPDVAMEVANLGIVHGVKLHYIGVGRADGVHRIICAKLEALCDEVWCCPAQAQAGRSVATVHQVWLMGSSGAKSRLYKRIQPWADMPAASHKEAKGPTSIFEAMKSNQRKGTKRWSNSKN